MLRVADPACPFCEYEEEDVFAFRKSLQRGRFFIVVVATVRSATLLGFYAPFFARTVQSVTPGLWVVSIGLCTKHRKNKT